MSRLPVLSFHSVDDSGSVISIAPGDFETTMRQLATAGWHGCTLSDALAACRAGPRSGSDAETRRPFGISFDDGYVSVMTDALPVLRDLGFTATVFVIAGRCGSDNRWRGQASWVPSMTLLEWAELETLIEAGWEIGSHGMEHVPLTSVTGAAASDDLGRARELITSRLGVSAPLLAYPYGAHDDGVCEVARQHHEAAFIDRPKLITGDDLRQPFRLPRVDAHYLRWFPAHVAMAGGMGSVYLAARRWAGRLRGPHWDARTFTAPGSRD